MLGPGYVKSEARFGLAEDTAKTRIPIYVGIRVFYSKAVKSRPFPGSSLALTASSMSKRAKNPEKMGRFRFSLPFILPIRQNGQRSEKMVVMSPEL